MLERRQIAFLTVVLVGLALVGLTIIPARLSNVRLGYTTRGLSFGSSENGFSGWQMPADTLISTSYLTNQTLSKFLAATFNVFPYEVQGGTILYLGLYMNGQLANSQKYTLTGTYETPASIKTISKDGVANFSTSMLGFTVSQFPLSSPITAGTEVTVTAWASNPIWVQLDFASIAHSFETFTSSSYVPTSTVVSETQNVCPFTLSVGLESSAG